MKIKFVLALIVPVSAFIMSCGPTDMQSDNSFNTNDLSAEIVDQNIDGVDNLNLSEETKSDYWLGYYIPSSYHYYTAPYYWGSYYPFYYGKGYYSGLGYGIGYGHGYGSFYYPYYAGWRY